MTRTGAAAGAAAVFAEPPVLGAWVFGAATAGAGAGRGCAGAASEGRGGDRVAGGLRTGGSDRGACGAAGSPSRAVRGIST